MEYELAVHSNRSASVCVSFTDYNYDGHAAISLGQRVFKGVGNFEYEWILEYIDPDEAEELGKALLMAASIVRGASTGEEDN